MYINQYLYMYDLFNDEESSSENTVPNDAMVNKYELERMWKEAAMS